MSDLKVAENVVASVHYTGTLPDTGEVFDTSEGEILSRSWSGTDK